MRAHDCAGRMGRRPATCGTVERKRPPRQRREWKNRLPRRLLQVATLNTPLLLSRAAGRDRVPAHGFAHVVRPRCPQRSSNRSASASGDARSASEAATREAQSLLKGHAHQRIEASGVYLIEGDLAPGQIDQVARELLADAVTETSTIGSTPSRGGSALIEVHPLPGVMDPDAEAGQVRDSQHARRRGRCAHRSALRHARGDSGRRPRSCRATAGEHRDSWDSRPAVSPRVVPARLAISAAGATACRCAIWTMRRCRRCRARRICFCRWMR